MCCFGKKKRSQTEQTPTNARPTTARPTNARPTAQLPTTARPIASRPTASRPTAARPTTPQPVPPPAQSATPRPTTPRSTTPQPTTSQPITVQPTTPQPTTVRPTTVRPTTVRPTTIQLTASRPAAPQSTASQTATSHPASAHPTSTQSVPAQPADSNGHSRPEASPITPRSPQPPSNSTFQSYREPTTSPINSPPSNRSPTTPEFQPPQHFEDQSLSRLSHSQFLDPQVSPKATPSFSDLWSQAFRDANGETQKWLQRQGLDYTGLAQPRDQIRELIGLVESNQLSEQNDKPLKVQIGNQTIIVREYVADAVAFITMVGDAAITFAPPQASMPWAVAKAILRIPVRQIEQKVALIGTVQLFVRIVRRGQIYEALYRVGNADVGAIELLCDALFDVYKAALELLASSETVFARGLARQTLASILRPDGATGKIKELFEKEQRLITEVQVCEASRAAMASNQAIDGIDDLKQQLNQLSSPLPRIDKNVTSLLARLEQKELGELMGFISKEMFGSSHATVVEARIRNTGDWLLANKDFRAWQETPSSSAVLCLTGTVGTGKTFLTSKVVDYIKQTLKTSQHDEGFAFFYCNRSGPSMQDPVVVLRSFVRQLASRAYDKPNLIQRTLVQKCETAKKEGRELGYGDCKDLILESLNLYSKTTIILDALDQSDIAAHNLCTTLIELMENSRKPVKIFISTRPDRKYLEALEDKCIITLDGNNQQEDIERFLEHKLYRTSTFMMRNQDIQGKIKHVLTTRSRGMFRWAHLQVNSLQDCTSDDAVHDWALKLPANLMQAYDKLWQTIKRRNRHDVALAERAIMWVLCSFQPLKSHILLEAIRYDVVGSTVHRKESQPQQRILSLCQDLLTIDQASGVWALPHASVAEYFESKGWTSWKCDAFASKVCLGVLDGPQPERREESSFADYAHLYWGKHVGRYDQCLGMTRKRKVDTDLTEALKRFLVSPGKTSANYRNWAESEFMGAKFRPSNIALFAMCRYGLYNTLRDWWLEGNITEDMALRRNQEGYNSLALAVQSGCMPMVKHLVTLIDVKHPDANRHAGALKTAIEENNLEILNSLIRGAGADVNYAPHGHSKYKSRYANATAAQYAALERPEVLQWLVDQGAVELERKNDRGCEFGNILTAAGAEGWAQSIHILLKAGVNVNAVVHDGDYGSALVSAARHENLEALRLLLKHGADPNLVLEGGKHGSALEASATKHYQLYTGARRQVQQLLLDAGADPAALSRQGKYGSSLAAAAFWGRKDILKAMIERVGTDRAIQTLRQSRHPIMIRYFEDEKDVYRWKSTAVFLAELGVSKRTLHKIGLWDVEPERNRGDLSYLGKYMLDYSNESQTVR
ncbi:hypothetical protein J3F84DRAFT_379755 [Trichoderma pleuroticola]